MDRTLLNGKHYADRCGTFADTLKSAAKHRKTPDVTVIYHRVTLPERNAGRLFTSRAAALFESARGKKPRRNRAFVIRRCSARHVQNDAVKFIGPKAQR